MTKQEFLEYQFEGYAQAKDLWSLFYDAEAEWRRCEEIQNNNARYLAAATRIKASRPGISDDEVDRIIRREHREVRFDLPASDRRGRFGLFHLRRLIEEKLEKARAAKDAGAVGKWQKAAAALQRLAPQGDRVPLPPLP
ncbi:MAG TPA: hypothetical protein VIG69_12955 [Candidatus Methylomirabilis sp.]|jgi:hypothetical protein